MKMMLGKMTHGKMWWRLLAVFSLAVIVCMGMK